MERALELLAPSGGWDGGVRCETTRTGFHRFDELPTGLRCDVMCRVVYEIRYEAKNQVL
jgi:hypothetical protein